MQRIILIGNNNLYLQNSQFCPLGLNIPKILSIKNMEITNKIIKSTKKNIFFLSKEFLLIKEHD